MNAFPNLQFPGIPKVHKPFGGQAQLIAHYGSRKDPRLFATFADAYQFCRREQRSIWCRTSDHPGDLFNLYPGGRCVRYPDTFPQKSPPMAHPQAVSITKPAEASPGTSAPAKADNQTGPSLNSKALRPQNHSEPVPGRALPQSDVTSPHCLMASGRPEGNKAGT